MERKTECSNYNSCLSKAAKSKGNFDCASCGNFSKLKENSAQSFEEELAFIRVPQEVEKFQCLKCKEIKTRSEFGNNVALVGGLNKWCKSCVAKAARDNWRKKHPDRPHRQERETEMPRERKNVGFTCSVKGCEKAAASCGMCWMHYSRMKKGKSLDEPPKRGVLRWSQEQKSHTDNRIGLIGVTKTQKSPNLEKAVEILIQHGLLSRAKLDAALELVKE